jgi:hypothetical protein
MASAAHRCAAEHRLPITVISECDVKRGQVGIRHVAIRCKLSACNFLAKAIKIFYFVLHKLQLCIIYDIAFFSIFCTYLFSFELVLAQGSKKINIFYSAVLCRKINSPFKTFVIMLFILN